VVCGACENRSFVVFSRLVCQIVTCQSLVEELVVFDFFAFVFGESGREAFFRRLHSFGLVNVVLLQFVSLFLKNKPTNPRSLITPHAPFSSLAALYPKELVYQDLRCTPTRTLVRSY
jgi:hypothetical protein